MPNEHSTLTSLFTDIADAIREKDGSTAPIVADAFPAAVRAIPSGGEDWATPIIERTISGSYTNLSASRIGDHAFTSCSSLAAASFPACTTIGTTAFINCNNLLSIYLLNSSVAVLGGSNAFNSTPIAGYTTSTGGVYGSIFVRASLLSDWQAATNWTFFSSRFVGLTDEQIAALEG